MKTLVALVAVAGLAGAAAADVIDQNQPQNDAYMASFGQGDLAQSFQTQSASNVSGADIQLMDFGGGSSETITISLFDNLPNQGGNLMAQGSAVGTEGQWVDVFWSPQPIAQNVTYYLVFTSAQNTEGIYGSTVNPYAFGQTCANSGFGSFPDFDYTFRTYTAVPTPGALAALGLGGLVATRRRR
ncbi:MAG: PEP-CTERM sorting domain-containing protein [Phycisphaerales bacterium]|nr:PEP-CTERM sorting domain-containing protein [Phycisphaerales bacterium]